MSSLRRIPFALRALFVVVAIIAAFAYAINAWQVFGFARHVWRLPFVLCFGAAVVADALSLAGLFATYLLRTAPAKVRAYAWFVFLGMTGLSIAAAESFASWRRLEPAAKQLVQEDAKVAAAAIVVALALAVHLLIVANRHARPAGSLDITAAEEAAGVPVDLTGEIRQPGVYRAIGAEGERPLYIGSTDHLAGRIASHKTSSGWFGEVVRWTFEPYPTIDDARAAERVLVEAENPVHNRNLRAGGVTRRRNMPEGTTVETLPPSVDVATIPPPRVPAPMPQRRRRNQPDGSDRRDIFAKRVVAGERAADVAQDAGVSKRAVEQWVRAYKDRSVTDGTPDPVPTGLTPLPSLGALSALTSENVRPINGNAPEVEVTR